MLAELGPRVRNFRPLFQLLPAAKRRLYLEKHLPQNPDGKYRPYRV